MKQIIWFSLAFVISPALLAAPELKGNPSELSAYLLDARKIISIAGEGEEKVEADQAIISLNIKTEEKSLDEALNSNDKIQTKVRDALVQAGITLDKIRASNFSSTPDYGWFKEKPKSYAISREIKVTISDATQMQAIAKVVDKTDEVFLGAMEFEDSHKEQNEMEAMQKALDKVLAKKALYEKNFSVSLALIKVMDQRVVPVYAAPRRAMKAEAFSGVMTDSAVEQSTPPVGRFAGVTYRSHIMAEFEVAK